MNLYDEFRGVLAAFDRDKIDYAVVGALAVAIWGAPRATGDIDLLIQPCDRHRAMKAAPGQGFTLSALPVEFMKARAARPQDVMDIQNLREGDRWWRSEGLSRSRQSPSASVCERSAGLPARCAPRTG